MENNITKKIKKVITAFDVDMAGILVKQAIPTQNTPNVDPFLLLHHGRFTFNNDAKALHQGIGPHPHRGFSPVTFVIDGEVHHRDSRGNNQIAKKGEIQWMDAGAGIIHSERPSENLVAKNETQEIIQLWINSPTASKMKEPRYRFLAEPYIPKIFSEDGNITTKVISGTQKNERGAITTEGDILVLWADTTANGTETYTIPDNQNTMLYVVKGTISVKGHGLIENNMLAIFDIPGNEIKLTANTNTSFLLLSGLPLNEKIAQQGPFVMNTETQLLEAQRDYQMGKMGVLIED
jgi:hypothetical protein